MNPADPLPPRFITKRIVWGLGVVLLLHAALVCGAVWGPLPGFPLSKVLNPETLPGALVGLAVALGLLLAPAWAGELDCGLRMAEGGLEQTVDIQFTIRNPRSAVGGGLARSLFLGMWQGAVLGYFLLVASRLVALDGAGILRSSTLVATASGLAILLAARLPRAYAGLVFFWVVGLPIFCYLLTEIFLSTPAGAAGGLRASSPEAATLRRVVNGALGLSPGTAAIGALHGRLVSGEDFGWKETGVFLALSGACGAAVFWGRMGLRARPLWAGMQARPTKNSLPESRK